MKLKLQRLGLYITFRNASGVLDVTRCPQGADRKLLHSLEVTGQAPKIWCQVTFIPLGTFMQIHWICC